MTRLLSCILILCLLSACTQSHPKQNATSQSATENDKIEKLIQYVAAMKDATFLRNGKSYNPQEAADHMRKKWRAVDGKIQTASQFIDYLASQSSTTGKPYKIRLKDGKEVTTHDYLHDRLKQIEQPAK
jgi:membrane-bound lytic murein transglycosylase